MGTTITAAIVDAEGEEVCIGHVGDSRAYRLRDGRLERLTRDHSLVEEMRRKGQITDAQAEDHPQRSIITRALGPEPDVEVDVQTVPAAPGDTFLLCSDGLTTMVDEERIRRALAVASSMKEAVGALVDAANRAGGRDNITALAFRLGDAAAPRRAPESATLVGGAAAEAGLTATEVRRRAAGAAAARRREQLAAKPPRRRLRAAARALAVLALLAAGHRRRLVREPTGVVPGHRLERPRRPLSRPALRASVRPRRSTRSATRARSRPARCRSRRREAVTGHSLRSRSDAVSLIEDIERSQGVP